MKTNEKLRIVIPLTILAVAGVAYAAHASVGTLSAIGWESIALICPLGALGTMLASKMMVHRAVISLLLAVAAILLLGRAFCGWVCPVPVWQKLRGLFKRQDTPDAKAEVQEVSKGAKDPAPLTAAEKKSLAGACGGGCASCADRKPASSRHFILGGTLLSAAIFGFPVFCLICPIGLSFALVFALIALFGAGDVTWSVVLIPIMILAEVVFFRKWCSHLCPLSALMSLVAKANRTFLPVIDDEKCLETAHGATCGRCAEVCEVAINPRRPELGTTFNECTRCRACAEVCPGNAISLPLMPKRRTAERSLAETPQAAPTLAADDLEEAGELSS